MASIADQPAKSSSLPKSPEYVEDAEFEARYNVSEKIRRSTIGGRLWEEFGFPVNFVLGVCAYKQCRNRVDNRPMDGNGLCEEHYRKIWVPWDKFRKAQKDRKKERKLGITPAVKQPYSVAQILHSYAPGAESLKSLIESHPQVKVATKKRSREDDENVAAKSKIDEFVSGAKRRRVNLARDILFSDGEGHEAVKLKQQAQESVARARRLKGHIGPIVLSDDDETESIAPPIEQPPKPLPAAKKSAKSSRKPLQQRHIQLHSTQSKKRKARDDVEEEELDNPPMKKTKTNADQREVIPAKKQETLSNTIGKNTAIAAQGPSSTHNSATTAQNNSASPEPRAISTDNCGDQEEENLVELEHAYELDDIDHDSQIAKNFLQATLDCCHYKDGPSTIRMMRARSIYFRHCERKKLSMSNVDTQ